MRFFGRNFVETLQAGQLDTSGMHPVEAKVMQNLKREDTNYYRKVSKYDLDRQSVNWEEYRREKARQMTENAKRNKENIQNKKSIEKTMQLFHKVNKINSVSKVRQSALEQSRMTAQKNQENLASLIKQTKEMEMLSPDR